MNEKEIKEIIEEIGRSCPETNKGKMAWNIPNPQTYNSESEGIQLLIEKSTIPESSIPCLKAVVDKHTLKMAELTKGYLVIYTPRKA